MKLFLVVLSIVFLAFAADTREDVGDYAIINSGTVGGASGWDYPQAVLFDNGPFVTGVGTGAGGADVCEMGADETTFGNGFQVSAGNMIADQFVVPSGETWDITKITVFGYQTGSGTTSTITGAHLTVWDNPPDSGTLVYGDQGTSVMTTTGWTNCYRVNNGDTSNSDRPIMYAECELTDLSLGEGEYWLVVQLDGSGSSGPWANPVTITGQPDTGDSIQYTSGGWAPLAMGGTGAPIGLPFILESGTQALEAATWAGIKTSF